jgi:hypothetical protein
MQREIPVAVAVEMVWRPSIWIVTGVGGEMGGTEHQNILNAEWATPSADWSILGQRLQFFFDSWRPSLSTKQHIVSLVVAHFGNNFAIKAPSIELEKSLQRSLRKRYIYSTPFQRFCCAPGFGGDYNSGSKGICKWWSKVLSLWVVIFSIGGILLISSSAQDQEQYQKQDSLNNEKLQEIELMNAFGLFTLVVAGVLALPAVWVMFIQLVRTVVSVVAFCFCCVIPNNDFRFCDCCDLLLPSCCCRQSNQVQPIAMSGEILEKEHTQRRRARRQKVAGWSAYSNNSSCFELQLYGFYCCLLSDCHMCLSCFRIFGRACTACGQATEGLCTNVFELCGSLTTLGGNQCVQCCQCFGECFAELGSCCGECDLGALDCAC